MNFGAEFRRVMDLFDQGDIDVAVVGGWALAVHGVVRATVDIELLVRPEQADMACAAAMSLGFTMQNPPMSLHDGAIVIRRVVRAQPDWNDGVLVLDFLLVTQELEPVWAGRRVVESAFGRVPVVSLEGLIRLKSISGRPQDLEDIQALARLGAADLDGDRSDEETPENAVRPPPDTGYSL